MEWLQDLLKEVENGEMLAKQIAEKLKQEFVGKADFDAMKTAREELEKQMKARDLDISELKKTAGDNTELQKKYEELQNKYKTDMEEMNQNITQTRKNAALDMAIVQAKGKNVKAIKALLDTDKITVKEDGTLEGLNLETLKETDSYLFDIETITYEGNGFTSAAKKQDTSAVDSFVLSARKAAGLN